MEIITKNLWARNGGNLTYSFNYTLRIFCIEAIFVKKSRRNQGIGTKLIKRALALAAEFHKIHSNVCVSLKVDKDFKDFKLTKWFKKHGFIKGFRFKKLRRMYLYL